MPAGKQILTQLRKEILSLQGFQATPDRRAVDVGLGPIKYAFPNNQFPLGAIHEFCSPTKQNEAPSLGFTSGIVVVFRAGAGSKTTGGEAMSTEEKCAQITRGRIPPNRVAN